MIYKNIKKIYGPYLGKDNRYRISIKFNDNSKKTMSYPKYLMEQHLGRYLDVNEQIDHIDGNPLNNDISNLQILKLGEHQKLDVLRNKDITVNCKYCGKEFTINGSNLYNRNRTDRHSSGYFCSKTCSGKYGKDIQLGKVKLTKTDKVLPEKYKVKSAQAEKSDVEEG